MCYLISIMHIVLNWLPQQFEQYFYLKRVGLLRLRWIRTSYLLGELQWNKLPGYVLLLLWSPHTPPYFCYTKYSHRLFVLWFVLTNLRRQCTHPHKKWNLIKTNFNQPINVLNMKCSFCEEGLRSLIFFGSRCKITENTWSWNFLQNRLFCPITGGFRHQCFSMDLQFFGLESRII